MNNTGLDNTGFNNTLFEQLQMEESKIFTGMAGKNPEEVKAAILAEDPQLEVRFFFLFEGNLTQLAFYIFGVFGRFLYYLSRLNTRSLNRIDFL